MRIDLGAGGKIVGTRKVSPNGQVSGLREFAGREVLVVIPGEGNDDLSAGSLPYLKGIEEVVRDQVQRTVDQYLALQKAYTAPFAAATDVLSSRKSKGTKREP
jgi:hypothetical protein